MKNITHISAELFSNKLSPDELNALHKSGDKFGIVSSAFDFVSSVNDLIAEGNDFNHSIAYQATIMTLTAAASFGLTSMVFGTGAVTIPAVIGGIIVYDSIDYVLSDSGIKEKMKELFSINGEVKDSFSEYDVYALSYDMIHNPDKYSESRFAIESVVNSVFREQGEYSITLNQILTEGNEETLFEMQKDGVFVNLTNINDFSIVRGGGFTGTGPEIRLLSYSDHANSVEGVSQDELNSIFGNNNIEKYYFEYIDDKAPGLEKGPHTLITTTDDLMFELDVDGNGDGDYLFSFKNTELKYTAGRGGGPMDPFGPDFQVKSDAEDTQLSSAPSEGSFAQITGSISNAATDYIQ
ncbi:hypothetical protein [Carnimonas bestiolae]|uniref:hypothetical protein n=1 Tax=Carnimonas bestiolae TaxID=3402172 RepID=UPI003EDBBCB7